MAGRGLDLAHAMRWLAAERNETNVLVEAGPALVGSLVREGLVDECRVFVEQAAGVASAIEACPAQVGVTRRLWLRGLKDATVRSRATLSPSSPPMLLTLTPARSVKYA